jgi:hypothetical protein
MQEGTVQQGHTSQIWLLSVCLRTNTPCPYGVDTRSPLDMESWSLPCSASSYSQSAERDVERTRLIRIIGNGK